MSANGINIRATKQIKELDSEDYLVVGIEGRDPHHKIKVKDFIALLPTPVIPVPTDTWLSKSVTITPSEIQAVGTTPVELLEAPGLGKYYEYYWILETIESKDKLGYFLTNNPLPNDNYFIGDKSTFIGQLFPYLGWDGKSGINEDSFVMGSSYQAHFVGDSYDTFPNAAPMPYPQIINTPVQFSTWLGNNPYTFSSLDEYSIIIKLKYRILDFNI